MIAGNDGFVFRQPHRCEQPAISCNVPIEKPLEVGAVTVFQGGWRPVQYQWSIEGNHVQVSSWSEDSMELRSSNGYQAVGRVLSEGCFNVMRFGRKVSGTLSADIGR